MDPWKWPSQITCVFLLMGKPQRLLVAESIRRARLVRAACKIAQDAVDKACAPLEVVAYVEPAPASLLEITTAQEAQLYQRRQELTTGVRRELAIIHKNGEGNPIRQGLTPTETEDARRIKLWNE